MSEQEQNREGTIQRGRMVGKVSSTCVAPRPTPVCLTRANSFHKNKGRSGSPYLAWPAGLSRDCRAYHVSGPVAVGGILESAF